jgi:hypothetical protein
MNAEQLFAIWAPDHLRWSDWAKPTLFVALREKGFRAVVPGESDYALAAGITHLPADGTTALVLDLDGTVAVNLAVPLARGGYTPVPLFNGTDGPNPLVPVDLIIAALLGNAPALAATKRHIDAPPAFLLEARREGMGNPRTPGAYDNRWIVLPQDFPSARVLREAGIKRVVIVTRPGRPIAEDLLHVALRWREGGLTVLQQGLGEAVSEPALRRPLMFRWWFQRFLALMGFRRNSAGGFGGVIPQPSSHSGVG